MNRGLNHFLISIVSICALTSCSEEKTEHDALFKVEISKVRQLELGFKGLSSDPLFPPYMLAEDKKSVLLLNSQAKTIDTLFFNGEEAILKSGNIMETEGPFAFPRARSFFQTKSGTHFIQPRGLISWFSADSSYERTIKFDKLEAFQPYPLISFSGLYDVYWGLDFHGYDPARDEMYLMSKDLQSGKIIFFKYAILTQELTELPAIYDSDLLKKHQLQASGDGLILMKNNLPYINVLGDSILMSYVFSNEIIVYNTQTKASSTLDYTTYNFPSEKIDHPDPIGSNSRKEAEKTSYLWDYDVSYSIMDTLPTGDGYFRMVKGPQEKGQQQGYEMFIEVFDINLIKLGEINLSEIQPDVGKLFFLFKDGIFIKGKSQETEDVLNYYVLKIEL
ncbi:hypothetical protein [Algoriphagus sp.]|uniref:hypothetical protein n=1 Tax=Algoriphagus sp. TaxID=1872435 RepID=UPI0032954711